MSASEPGLEELPNSVRYLQIDSADPDLHETLLAPRRRRA